MAPVSCVKCDDVRIATPASHDDAVATCMEPTIHSNKLSTPERIARRAVMSLQMRGLVQVEHSEVVARKPSVGIGNGQRARTTASRRNLSTEPLGSNSAQQRNNCSRRRGKHRGAVNRERPNLFEHDLLSSAMANVCRPPAAWGSQLELSARANGRWCRRLQRLVRRSSAP